MKGRKVLFQEFGAIARNKKILIPVIAVLFIPVLYAGMFLWAFWDPYEKLAELPVAVVNLDQGASFEGETLHVGNDLVKELKKDGSFGWEFVSLDKAKQGFKDRKYYMMIQIPSNFSENATTLTKENPTQLELFYIPNESLNFLSSQIGESGMEKIKGQLQKTITKTYAEKVFTKVANGLNEATDGASQLNEGSVAAKDGSIQLKDGLITLTDKSQGFKDGLTKAKDGSSQLKDGLGTLASKTPALSEGINDLKAGSGQLAGGLNTLSDKSKEMEKGVSDLKTGSTQLKTGVGTLDSGIGQMQQKVNDVLVPGSNQLLAGSEKVAAGLKEASDGVNQLNDQMPLLVDGSSQVSQGASKLTQGLTDFEAVINQLTAGLPAEQQQVIKEQYAKLLQGSEEVKTGANKVSQGLAGAQPKITALANGQNELLKGANELKVGQQQAVAGVSELNNKLVEMKAGSGQLVAGSTALSSGMNQLSEGSIALIDGVTQLRNGSVALDNGLGLLQSNSTSLISGVNALQQGSIALDSGVGQLQTGSVALVDGVGQLKEGSSSLADGLGKIEDGTKQLKTELNKSAVEAEQSKTNNDELNMFASPVKVKTEKIGEVPNYGTGFAPYFLSLGLFVGALLISIVFPLRESLGSPRTAFGKWASKTIVLMFVGIIQALIAVAILIFGLGIEVQSVPSFIAFSILTSWTFLALIQFFVTSFGDVGRFLAILVLILQLTTSAGTFPLELIPSPLQVFNQWLPMTYTVSGLKAVISSGDYSFMWQNISVLCGYIVVLLGGTYVYFFLHQKRMNAQN
ncbi:MAG: YhgE/Pip family protein [Bacillaceae bacterium]